MRSIAAHILTPENRLAGSAPQPHYQWSRLAPRPAARYTAPMIAARRLDEPRRPRHPLARRKPASGGPNLAPRHRISRSAPQPTDAPSKNRLRYDGAWRGAPMPQNVSLGGDMLERVQQLQDKIAAGKAGEATAADIIVEAGYRIVGQQVYINTPIGLRIIDFLAIGSNGALTGFEVKTGYSARYSGTQRQKDQYIERHGGTLTSRGLLGGGLQYGDRLRYHTLVVNILDLPL